MKYVRPLTETEKKLPPRPGYIDVTKDGTMFRLPKKGEEGVRKSQGRQAMWRLACDAQETAEFVQAMTTKAADAVQAILRTTAENKNMKKMQVVEIVKSILSEMERVFSYHETRYSDDEEPDSPVSIA